MHHHEAARRSAFPAAGCSACESPRGGAGPVAADLSILGSARAHVAGCGGLGDCGDLLAGRWSAWFGLPVAFPASLVYLAILCSSRVLSKATTARGGCGMPGGFSPCPRRWRPGRRFGSSSSTSPSGKSAPCAWRHMRAACRPPRLSGQKLRRWPRALLRPAGVGLAILVLGQALVFRHPYRLQADTITQSTRRPDRHVRILAEAGLRPGFPGASGDRLATGEAFHRGDERLHLRALPGDASDV